MRAWIYDAALLPLTARWYREVIDRLPDESRMLDVGIGTAGALVRNADLVKSKQMHVVGVDIDADYISRAKKAVEKASLTEQVEVRHQSIYDYGETGFDAVYFSASFMLMPDPPAVLQHVMSLLTPEGRVFFTQTFEEQKNPFMERAKPLLHKITSIHFGQVTYEQDFLDTVEGAGLDVLEHVRLGGSKRRSSRLIVGRPCEA